MDYYFFQQKLSQIEERLKKHITTLVLNNEAVTLSEYVDAFCIFINDFDVVKFFGEDIINNSYLVCYLNINKYETKLELEWNFITDYEIDQNRNMLLLNLILVDRYSDIELSASCKAEYLSHNVSSDEIYKVQYKGENIFFDVNMELSLQKIMSDIHFQVMQNEEPIAMSIYSYYDN